ncbi:hypothetical protein [Streptomyces sp. URMC 124]|uniref:hypothetical protein n=1 Tax=Streptomyces sp. URMC 124 TaxID=3423405 RepID=UPI003F1A0B5C
MKDWKNMEEADFTAPLVQHYTSLAMICSRLPIPIQLPEVENGIKISTLTDAVARLAKVSDEIPGITEDVMASLFTSSTCWLVAVDLFFAYEEEPTEFRVDGFAMSMINARSSLADAVKWVLRNGE